MRSLPVPPERTSGWPAELPSTAPVGLESRVDTAWPPLLIRSVADAILHAIIYADLFDYPLTTREIHRFLPGCAAPLAVVHEQMASNCLLRERLGSRPPYWYLAGREHLVALRQAREAFSQALWPQARRYGRLLATFPFVQLVAISGSLTMNNASDPRDDIDLLLVARTHRVWLVRGEALLLVRIARRLGTRLCPNFVLGENRMRLDQSDYFTAHELAHLVPLYGYQVYRRLMAANIWASTYLPNAWQDHQTADRIRWPQRWFRWALETLLGERIGDSIEQWERDRKIPRLRHEATQAGSMDAEYGPDICKGHQNSHGSRVSQRYAARLKSLHM